MEKSRDAFRTISEVAEWLDVPTHVLRFWESRFSQIKPVKRAGGRRYYRPSDMRVIGGVKVLLHDQGMTIRGVQKLFREQGIKHISSFSPKLFGEGIEEYEGDLIEKAPGEGTEAAQPASPAAAARRTRDAEPAPVEDAEIVDEQDAPEETQEPEEASAHIESADAADVPSDEALTSGEDDVANLFDAVAEAEASPAPAPAPTIPLADVPNSDSSDDSPAHARGPSVAARLRVQKRAALMAHRDDLAETARRLRDLHGRMS